MAPKSSVADSRESGSSTSDDANLSGGENEAGDEELPQAPTPPDATHIGNRERSELKRTTSELEDDMDDEAEDIDEGDELIVPSNPSGRGSGRGGPARSSRAQAAIEHRAAVREAKRIMKNNVAQGFESNEIVEQAFENDLQEVSDSCFPTIPSS
jgi:hypothetical protein